MAKVLLVNGSAHKNGNTNEVLEYAAKQFAECGIDAEIFWVGAKPITGCIGCNQCMKKGQCVFDDTVNEFVEKAKDADGFIFGTPVHYAAMSGSLTSFMDRAFYSAALSGRSGHFTFKPAGSVITARRAGTTATYDQINKYFGMNQMPIISSRYWNMVHSGMVPEDVYRDEEGIQTVRILVKNMAYYIKCMEMAKENGIVPPTQEEVTYTSFIR